MPFEIPSTPFLLFTGRGGVGKTSLACATALALAEAGERTLIVSTDPASNLDEVLEAELGGEPTPIPGVGGLFGMNVDPEEAARRYRERIVGPYRGLLPEAALRSMEEGLSGACTTEIAAFDEFTALLSDEGMGGFDRVVFDTAPTGHTLRLLSLPAAWTGYLAENAGGATCLGPIASLERQRSAYAAAVDALKDGSKTTVVLVARPDAPSLREAARASGELADLDVGNQRLVLNGTFEPSDASDPIAAAFAERGKAALDAMPSDLAGLPRTDVPLLPFSVAHQAGLRALLGDRHDVALLATPSPAYLDDQGLETLVDEIERGGHGVVMTMGKGGVGKTSVAAAIAVELARRGHPTLLTTTDPAAHVREAVEGAPENLEIARIDPAAELARYALEVMEMAGASLDEDGRSLLEEELRAPCTEEIAVFRAFADTVAEGRGRFVVVDTAPTGHTVLLLDAAEAYHREVSRASAGVSDAVRDLLPRLRDPEFTRVVLVTLPEPTPVHEAAALAEDLERAGILPFAVVVNQSLAAAGVRDPLLAAKARHEASSIAEAERLSPRFALLPWSSTPLAVRRTAVPS